MTRNRRPSNRRGLRRPLWRVVELTRWGPVERQRGEHHDILRWFLAHRGERRLQEPEVVR